MDCDFVGFLDIVQNISSQKNFCSSAKPYLQNNLLYIVSIVEGYFMNLHGFNNEYIIIVITC